MLFQHDSAVRFIKRTALQHFKSAAIMQSFEVQSYQPGLFSPAGRRWRQADEGVAKPRKLCVVYRYIEPDKFLSTSDSVQGNYIFAWSVILP
ncbi:hypothetical protein B7W85_10985 [Allorhizobium ampelinum]|nr:hypothetical protein B7W85_10985 [Allorhizobium ampelinum]